VGSLVVLAPDYASYSDAGTGPLSLGQVGVVVQTGATRLQVKPQSGGDRVWWYVVCARAAHQWCMTPMPLVAVCLCMRRLRAHSEVLYRLMPVGTTSLRCAWLELEAALPVAARLWVTAWY
jgi:hypothetical protein